MNSAIEIFISSDLKPKSDKKWEAELWLLAVLASETVS